MYYDVKPEPITIEPYEAAAIWWLSSMPVGQSSSRNITATGTSEVSAYATNNGVVPAFVLSSDEQVQFPPISNNLYDLA
jgi:hypothetical protein